MPTSTDLVTDLPADFETFGQAVDTTLADLKGGTTGQVLSKASNTDMDFTWVAPTAGDIEGITAGVGISGGGTSGTVTVTNSMATAITTNGDLIYGTGSGTFTRRAIGSTGQILTVSGGVPAWSSPTPTADNWTLVNAGGTTLTGAQTVTVSGISGANQIMVLVKSASSVNGASTISVRLNGDTGANYFAFGILQINGASYSASNYSTRQGNAQNQLEVGKMANLAASGVSGYVLLTGCNTAGLKMFTQAGNSNADANEHIAFSTGGYYASTSTISSVSIFSSTGNLDAGQVFVYTTA